MIRGLAILSDPFSLSMLALRSGLFFLLLNLAAQTDFGETTFPNAHNLPFFFFLGGALALRDRSATADCTAPGAQVHRAGPGDFVAKRLAKRNRIFS
jgi:hypothetical protein